jgi:PAS domain S-box-containing protein
MGTPIRVLIVEDSEEDALLMLRELKRGGYDPVFERVETAEDMNAALDRSEWDVVLADYSMPHFSGLAALKLLREKEIGLPFIIVSGNIGEDIAVAAMKAGAHDYLMKNNLKRLVPAIEQEIREANVRRKLKKAEEALRESEEKYRHIFEHSPIGIGISDFNGKVVTANKAMETTMGYSTEELEKVNLPDTFENMEDRKALLEAVNRYGGVVDFPIRLKRKGGTPYDALLSVSLIHLGDKNFYHTICQDITERKRAEERLRLLSERYEAILAAVPDIIMEVDNDKVYTWANRAGLEFFGEDVLGKEAAYYFEGKQETYGKVQPLFNGSENVIYLESWQRRRDGEKRLLAWWCRVLKDANGKVTGALSTARDITDRNRAEEALEKSEETYRLLVENASEAIFVIQDGMLRFFNIKNIELTGYSKEELTSTPFINFVHPDDREAASERYLKRLKGEEPSGINVFRLVNKAGNIRWVEANSVLISWEGKPATLNLLNDITERKQAEEALRRSKAQLSNALKMAKLGHWELDIDRGLFTFSDNFYEIFRTTAEKVGSYQMSVADYAKHFVHPEDSLLVAEETRKAIETDDPNFSRYLEHRMLYSDGSVGHIAVRFFIVKDNKGKTIKTYGVNQDITERKRAEEEMAALQEQLHQSQKMESIGRLAGGIAHDFNNLLTVIKGYGQLSLLELRENDPLKGNILEIQKASERAADLTRQLLAFSRRQILEMKVLDLNAILHGVDKMLRRVIGEDIELVTLLAEDLGRVKTDPGQIEQMIMNLAVNARDAMPSGGKLTIETSNAEIDETEVRSHAALTPGRYVMLSVSDTGVGMTPDIMEHVFEPFFTTKEKGKGTGLGLSTVYGIVKQSGGNILVYSEAGKGTMLKIYLPRMDEPLEEEKKNIEKEELPRGNETILVVEDEEEVRKVAVRMLGERGYKVLEASQGVDALHICAKLDGPIHLLLTDVVMPKMSGQEVAGSIISLRPGIKVLYMSGYTDNTIVHHGVLERGVNYIQKPFTVESLARKVREVLDN